MRVVVFGAEGFVGRAAVRAIARRGHDVLGLGKAARGDRLGVDIADAASVARLDLRADVIVNCAARVPAGADTLANHEPMFRVNAIGAAHVAEVAVRAKARLVYCSTLAVVARPWPVPLDEDAATRAVGPVAAYAASKRAGEEMSAAIAAAGGVAPVTLRFSALYGETMKWIGVLPAFVDASLGGKRLSAASGAHADFLHVDDAAECVAAAVESDAVGVVNAASGIETSIEQLARAILRAVGRAENDVVVTQTPASRAVVAVARMRDVLRVKPAVSIEDGVASLVKTRRAER